MCIYRCIYLFIYLFIYLKSENPRVDQGTDGRFPQEGFKPITKDQKFEINAHRRKDWRRKLGDVRARFGLLIDWTYFFINYFVLYHIMKSSEQEKVIRKFSVPGILINVNVRKVFVINYNCQKCSEMFGRGDVYCVGVDKRQQSLSLSGSPPRFY